MDITVDSKNHIFYANGIATSNSHSVGYGTTSYESAYLKTHFPIHFFTASLYYAHEKQDEKYEIKHLHSDLKRLGINIDAPKLSTFRNGNLGEFGIHTGNNIHFGIHNVKGIGLNHIKKFAQAADSLEKELNKKIEDFSWLEILVLFSDNTTKTVINNLINVGFFGENRKKKLFEYSIWGQLTKIEKTCMKNNISKYDNLLDGLKILHSIPKKEGGPSNKNRVVIVEDLIASIKNPPYKLNDTPSEIANNEKKLLGIPVSTTVLDESKKEGNTTIKEFLDGKAGTLKILIEVDDVREYTIKNGQNTGQKMASVSAEDETGRLDGILLFAVDWEKNKHLFYPGAAVLITGVRSKTNGFIVQKAIGA